MSDQANHAQNQRILIIGYGNPGRQDDGLGPALIDQLQKIKTDTLHLHSNYQLTVEDAYDICNFDQVIFVDASLDTKAPFSFEAITVTDDSGLGSHSLSPNGVIRLCETLYNHRPQAYVLGIKGYEYDKFDENLSEQAKENLLAALAFVKGWLAKFSADKTVLTRA